MVVVPFLYSGTSPAGVVMYELGGNWGVAVGAGRLPGPPSAGRVGQDLLPHDAVEGAVAVGGGDRRLHRGGRVPGGRRERRGKRLRRLVVVVRPVRQRQLRRGDRLPEDLVVGADVLGVDRGRGHV